MPVEAMVPSFEGRATPEIAMPVGTVDHGKRSIE